MLTINIDGLEQKVKPELNNSEKNVKSARELLTSIKIPSDFTYYSRLRSIPSTLLEIEEKMEEAEKWIDERIKMFTSAEKNNNNIVDSLVSSITSIGNFSNIGEGGCRHPHLRPAGHTQPVRGAHKRLLQPCKRVPLGGRRG